MTDKTKLDRTSAGAVLTSLHTDNQIDKGKLGRMIAEIALAGKKADACIHATAVATIYRSLPTVDGGDFDCSFATKLIAAMPKGSRSKALMAWFAAFSNIRFVRDDKSGVYSAKLIPLSSKMYVEARPAEALLKPFWTVEESSADPKAFDDDALGRRIAAIIKAAAADGANLSDKAKLTIAALTKLVPAV